MPAVQGVDYLSTVHMQDNDVEPRSFRMAIGQFATAVWLTRSWTKEEFLNTLAARGEFGFGWRGIHAAARGYFNKPVDQLALPETALIASRVADTRTDPWCEPEAAVDMRNRILTRMRDDGAISETDFQAASPSALGLASPPEGRPPCSQ